MLTIAPLPIGTQTLQRRQLMCHPKASSRINLPLTQLQLNIRRILTPLTHQQSPLHPKTTIPLTPHHLKLKRLFWLHLLLKQARFHQTTGIEATPTLNRYTPALRHGSNGPRL